MSPDAPPPGGRGGGGGKGNEHPLGRSIQWVYAPGRAEQCGVGDGRGQPAPIRRRYQRGPYGPITAYRIPHSLR